MIFITNEFKLRWTSRNYFLLIKLRCEKVDIVLFEIQMEALLSCRQTGSHNMAALIGERVGIKETGVNVTVPASPTAKLMYYLDCVAIVIQLDSPNLNRLRNYRSYYLLNDTEIDALLALVLLFSPDELIGKVFFPSEDCGGSSNQFFELSSVTHMLAVTDNVLIGGERKRVANIMLFKRSWLENNYISPLRSFEGRLQRLARGLPGRAPSTSRALPPPRSYSSIPRRPDPPSAACCCNIL